MVPHHRPVNLNLLTAPIRKRIACSITGAKAYEYSAMSLRIRDSGIRPDVRPAFHKYESRSNRVRLITTMTLNLA
jgi:hypothetical protein